MDDARFDDGYSTIQSTPATVAVGRNGQRVFHDLFTRVRDVGVDFQNIRNDISYCAPARAAMQTGLFRINHGVSDTDPPTYYKYVRKGLRVPKLYDSSTNHW